MELEEIEKVIKESRTRPTYPCVIIDYPLGSEIEVQKPKEHGTERKY